MPTDVERMAEVLEAHALWGEILVCDCGRWHFDAEVDNGPCSGHAAHVAEQLTAAGMGHIPTALRQAADAWQQGEWADTPRYPEIAQDRIAAANHVTAWLRARADRAGGDHV